MIILNATTKSLEVVLGAAVAATELTWTAHYVDILDSDRTISDVIEADGATNGTTAVTMVAAPAAGHTRQVKFLSVYEGDSVGATVIVRVNNNGTFRRLTKTALGVDETLQYSS